MSKELERMRKRTKQNVEKAESALHETATVVASTLDDMIADEINMQDMSYVEQVAYMRRRGYKI